MATFVLVHGAWHGPWCWERTRAQLEARGHLTVTPQLPSDTIGAGAEEYFTAVRDALSGRSDLVLVLHSMSGLLAPALIAEPAVTSLVLLAAMVPEPGATWADSGQQPYAEPMRQLFPQLQFDQFGRSWWEPADAAALFYHDCADADADAAVAQLRPDSSLIYQQPCPAVPTTKTPVTYLSCRADRAVDGQWNADRAKQLFDADHRQINTGHSPFWSAPAVLTAALDELALRNH
ncbi:alpha/beta fold hydrolase [Nocardia sp. NPDC004722]